MLGATIGAVVGIFFGIVGLFIGPVIGAIAGEFIAGKKVIAAGRAGWGSLLGNTRWYDCEASHRARHDHCFPHDRAVADLKRQEHAKILLRPI